VSGVWRNLYFEWPLDLYRSQDVTGIRKLAGTSLEVT